MSSKNEQKRSSNYSFCLRISRFIQVQGIRFYRANLLSAASIAHQKSASIDFLLRLPWVRELISVLFVCLLEFECHEMGRNHKGSNFWTRSPSLAPSRVQWSSARAANRELALIVVFVLLPSIGASLQVLCVDPNQFSAGWPARDRTRPQRTKPSDLKGIPTREHRWRETSDILHAIAHLKLSWLRQGLTLVWFGGVQSADTFSVDWAWSGAMQPRACLLDAIALCQFWFRRPSRHTKIQGFCLVCSDILPIFFLTGTKWQPMLVIFILAISGSVTQWGHQRSVQFVSNEF